MPQTVTASTCVALRLRLLPRLIGALLALAVRCQLVGRQGSTEVIALRGTNG
ncbi:hypothetical protein [Azonexus hydrophilus]|uniref:Uncharacterized protein n=1 Tax=Azonexus hydrophilus TaxID=418702 RepID=A0ABZ2XM73_9RHOO